MRAKDIKIGGEYYLLMNNHFIKGKIVARGKFNSIYNPVKFDMFTFNDGIYSESDISKPVEYSNDSFHMIWNEDVLCLVNDIRSYLEEFSKDV